MNGSAEQALAGQPMFIDLVAPIGFNKQRLEFRNKQLNDIDVANYTAH